MLMTPSHTGLNKVVTPGLQFLLRMMLASECRNDLATSTMKVDNLRHAADLVRISGHLADLNGVVGMRVDFEGGRIIFTHQPSLAPRRLAETVSRAGYPAVILRQSEASSPLWKKLFSLLRRRATGGPAACNDDRR